MVTKTKMQILWNGTTVYRFVIVIYLVHTLLFIFFSIGIPGAVKTFTNLSGSMLPYINKGSLSLVVSQHPFTYLPGDVVTFYSAGPEREIITHRIYDIRGNVYVTKEDNNEGVDVEVLRPSAVIGRVVANIPYIGYWISFLKGRVGNIFFIQIPAFAIIIRECVSIALYGKKKSKAS